MKPCSTSTGPTTAASAQCSSGELSPTQRIILRSLRNDGPATEAELMPCIPGKLRKSVKAVGEDLHELERRALVECKPSRSGVRFWHPVGEVA